MRPSREMVERAVRDGIPMGLMCGCRLTFRGTVEAPVVDAEPCMAHKGLALEASRIRGPT